MIIAFALLGYAFLLLWAGAGGLARARWPDRAPRLAVAAWLALTGSAVVSVTFGGLALVVPTVRVSAGLSTLLATCAMELRASYAHPGGAVLAGAGAVLGLAVIARVGWCTAGTLARAGLARRRHRRGLALAGRHDGRLGAVVLDHHDAAAWCLPGAGRQVVLTTAAVEALDEVQLTAVMAHERAHQRGHHHLLVSLAGSLAAAFPRVRAFRQGHEQVARLVELLADDAATAASPRLKVGHRGAGTAADHCTGSPRPDPFRGRGAHPRRTGRYPARRARGARCRTHRPLLLPVHCRRGAPCPGPRSVHRLRLLICHRVERGARCQMAKPRPGPTPGHSRGRLSCDDNRPANAGSVTTIAPFGHSLSPAAPAGCGQCLAGAW
jgi:Zn-dependent protease with chaperone function